MSHKLAIVVGLASALSVSPAFTEEDGPGEMVYGHPTPSSLAALVIAEAIITVDNCKKLGITFNMDEVNSVLVTAKLKSLSDPYLKPYIEKASSVLVPRLDLDLLGSCNNLFGSLGPFGPKNNDLIGHRDLLKKVGGIAGE